MNSSKLSSDSFVLLLLCSDLALSVNDVKHFTLKQWGILSKKLLDSDLRKPSSFLETGPEVWRVQLGIEIDEIERIKKLISRSGQLALELERLHNQGIWVTTRAEPTYPNRYKKLLRNQSPVIVFGAGDINILNSHGVAIVGSREVDEDGILFTQGLSQVLAQEGLTVISGGSRGVDTIAEHSAIQAGGRAISVLSDSMETTIRKKEIRNFIINSKMLVLSAYNPKARFKGYTAMERNKHIYTLAECAVVISATSGNGGTWGGATENLKNAWVPLFVRDSLNKPSGNSDLIKLGGLPINQSNIESKSSLKQWISKTIRENTFSRNTKNSDTSINDLFEVVWPLMNKALIEDRSVQELSNYFNITAEQMRVWLEKALKLEMVKRTQKGYKLLIKKPSKEIGDHEQKSLF